MYGRIRLKVVIARWNVDRVSDNVALSFIMSDALADEAAGEPPPEDL
jgi:hypothetical protein